MLVPSPKLYVSLFSSKETKYGNIHRNLEGAFEEWLLLEIFVRKVFETNFNFENGIKFKTPSEIK